jgi:hypothetical protein
MRVALKLLGIWLLFLLTPGCSAPKDVLDEARNVLPESCLALFNSGEYQEKTQNGLSGTPAFAIAMFKDGAVATCAYATGGGWTTTMQGRRDVALLTCERHRANLIQKNKRPIEKCIIYAEGNKIIYKK